MTYMIALLATGIAFGIADALWLSNAVPRIYRPMIGELLSDKLNVGAALAFYLIYICGIVFFAVRPALDEGSLMKAALYGAALGFVAFATYDLTNQATLRVWDVRLTLIDMAWGTFATGLAASIGYAVAARFS
ncbi:MAG: DUF2177 domain-containing protein [Alphaproteobacteria bacterium]|nr:MAG: DUF2177 domain-containing protein [Alphaproteobacteria bacterium]